LYATAALLEGCSFVNGGSQNTLDCPALWELAKQQLGVYCLGTDFKAGQTKFKTAAVEYLRTMGLTPQVIASSNHLGNNDMRNLASAKAASTAKLRVKHDIFAPWQEPQLDHKVSIMYTPFINDDKRDFVEYTSLGFLGQPHTMVTYTRASDSVLCVPLMIDAAVWCDFFAGRSWPYEKVCKAMAYLFKVPEGAAKGVDPGFFKQMQELKEQVLAAHESKVGHKVVGASSTPSGLASAKRRVRIRAEDEETIAEWAIPNDARIICAGLACVDMQLNEATGGDGGEGIETFQGEKSIGGGRYDQKKFGRAVIISLFILCLKCGFLRYLTAFRWLARLWLVFVTENPLVRVTCKLHLLLYLQSLRCVWSETTIPVQN
jgi:myo-inositol-1-phosphate synthase